MIGQNFMKVHEKLLYHIHHPVPFRYMEIPNFHYYFSTAMSGNATFFIFCSARYCVKKKAKKKPCAYFFLYCT